MKANKKSLKGKNSLYSTLKKYADGGKTPHELDQVVVKGEKGAGVKSSTVVARGKTGDDFTAKRQELIAAELAKLQKGKAPGYKPTDFERSAAMDNVRAELRKSGYTEQGVIRKDTKQRLTPEQEKIARERMK